MLNLILLQLIASVWGGVICDDFAPGDCKVPRGTEVRKLFQHQDWFNKGVPKTCDATRCRELCAEQKLGEGCCFWGVITKDMGLKDVTDKDFALTAGKSAQSCFFFKKADNNPDVDLYARRQDYRQVCKDSSKWKSCSKHSDCDGLGGANPLCKDNKCMPCSQCLYCNMGIDNTCGDGCYDHYYGRAMWEQRRCRKKSASMQFAVESTPIGTEDVAVYGFAMIGLGALVFGAYKHYSSGKSQGEHAQIL